MLFLESQNGIEEWKDAKATFTSNKEHLVICGKPVMERWETPLMHKHASIATRNGGRVLETGFGLGICATEIQNHNISEHVIVECNEDVFSTLVKWADTVPHPVKPLKGSWQDVMPTLQDGTFDGIMYDTYPLSEDTWHTHQFEFIKNHAYRLLKPGGVLTYCNITSWDEFMKHKYTDIMTMFKETQVPHLVEAGFCAEDITAEIVPVKPPPECLYCSHNEAIAPIIIKRK